MYLPLARTDFTNDDGQVSRSLRPFQFTLEFDPQLVLFSAYSAPAAGATNEERHRTYSRAVEQAQGSLHTYLQIHKHLLSNICPSCLSQSHMDQIDEYLRGNK
jgi:hypothetical protein